MAKGGLARQRFEERRQYNQIVGQLNQLRQAGYSTEDIRAAGNNAYNVLTGGAQQVTVRDGDTIETIAQTTGASPVDLLAANPELKQVRTGMVINAPVVNQDMRGRGYGQAPGGIGLPSNSALGGTTTNPGGWSGVSGSAGAANYNQTRPDYSILTTPRNSSGVPVSTANAQMRGRGYSQPAAPSFSGALYVPPGLSQTQRAAIPGILQGRGMSITRRQPRRQPLPHSQGCSPPPPVKHVRRRMTFCRLNSCLLHSPQTTPLPRGRRHTLSVWGISRRITRQP
jgi:hypothetical protein